MSTRPVFNLTHVSQKPDIRRIQFDTLFRQYKKHFADRNFQKALEAARAAYKLSPSTSVAHSQALCLHRLGRTEEAYKLARKFPPTGVDGTYFDLMADVCGALGKADEVRKWGSAALAEHDKEVANIRSLPLPDHPAPANVKTGVIVYSLFGSAPRYCEVAIMNCDAAAKYLPGWRCRFYCDDTVPRQVRSRIERAGGEIILVDEQTARDIHPLMWRFLAAEDPSVTRYLMRDADSLIGAREAAAVNAWIVSGKWFHVMRDYYTHTELMLAGLWGGFSGIIPNMRQEMLEFIKNGKYELSHIDQHFLRRRIWPTARQSVLSHDSQFTFFNNESFPHVPGASLDPRHHVGANQSTTIIAAKLNAPCSHATVTLRDESGQDVFSYDVAVENGEWRLTMPDMFTDRIERGEWAVDVRPVAA